MATSGNVLSKALHKLLDKRYEGAVRLVSRADTEAEIFALWEKLRELGQVGAGYWAIASHTHVAPEVIKQVFGEVHMLSHLHGCGVREMATQIAEMQRRDCRDRGAPAPGRGGPQRGAGRTRCGAYRIAGACRRSEHG